MIAESSRLPSGDEAGVEAVREKALVHRPRRLRMTAALRSLRREHRLHADQLVQPIFVTEDDAMAGPIGSMPGVRRLALHDVASEVERLAGLGVRGVLLFGLPAHKDAQASAVADEDGVVPRAIREARRAASRDELAIMTDVCLCAYTDHGHCGLVQPAAARGTGVSPVRGASDHLNNDESVALIARAAVVHARAGADVVAPSAMLDGVVGAIRAALDDEARRSGDERLAHTAIMSYAVKYASAFYGPFRDAAASAPAFGDRRSHQMDPASADEALLEARLDAREGADLVMVKPAGAYLDVISRLRRDTALAGVPIAAYQVSGEYAALVAAAERGWLDLRSAAFESLLAIRRAGATTIITYFAEQAARWLSEEHA